MIKCKDNSTKHIKIKDNNPDPVTSIKKLNPKINIKTSKIINGIFNII